jgi:hypothetical protein
MCEERDLTICKKCRFYLETCEYCIFNSEYKDMYDKEYRNNVKDSRIYKKEQ